MVTRQNCMQLTMCCASLDLQEERRKTRKGFRDEEKKRNKSTKKERKRQPSEKNRKLACVCIRLRHLGRKKKRKTQVEEATKEEKKKEENSGELLDLIAMPLQATKNEKNERDR